MSESKPVGRMAPRTGVTEPPTSPDRSLTASRGLWTMSETAEWLNVPERMVRRLVAERRIPFVKVGRYVRFRPEDVEGWRVAGIVSGHCSCRAGALCDHPAKHPLNQHGVRAAATDPAQIANWWRTWPWAGVAIRTGAPSGLVIVDIDPAHGGLRTLDELARSGQIKTATLETLQVRTGGAGHYLYYQHPQASVPNTSGQLPIIRPTPGIDLRGDGGYIIAPPSAHHSRRRYQWEPTSRALLELPVWAGPAPPTPRPEPPRIPAVGADRLARYAEAALRNESCVVASAGEGQGNEILNRASYKLGTLVGAGVLDAGVVDASLTDAAAVAGLNPRESAATIRSGRADSRDGQPSPTSGAGRSDGLGLTSNCPADAGAEDPGDTMRSERTRLVTGASLFCRSGWPSFREERRPYLNPSTLAAERPSDGAQPQSQESGDGQRLRGRVREGFTVNEIGLGNDAQRTSRGRRNSTTGCRTHGSQRRAVAVRQGDRDRPFYLGAYGVQVVGTRRAMVP